MQRLPLFFFSLALGTAMAEIAWRTVGVQIGETRSGRPTARLLAAVSAIFGGALILVWLATLPEFAEMSSAAWDLPLLAYAVAILWVGAKLFEKLTEGLARSYFAGTAIVLNISFGVLCVTGVMLLAGELARSFSAFVLIALLFSIIGVGISCQRWRK